METEKIFVTGYAKVPKGITATELYSVIGMGLIVYKSSGEILEADCTLATRTGRKYLQEILTGKNLQNIDEIINEIKMKYFGHAKKAIISALKMCNEKYQAALRQDYDVDA